MSWWLEFWGGFRDGFKVFVLPLLIAAVIIAAQLVYVGFTP